MASSTRKKIASSNNKTPNDDPLSAFTPIKPRLVASHFKPLNLLQLGEMLYKTMQYVKGTYEKAISANEVVVRTENIINEFIIEYKMSEERNNVNNNNEVIKGFVKKNSLVYHNSMQEAIYTALIIEHPNKIKKIENIKGVWPKYWSEVLQSTVHYEFHIKRASYVQNIKDTIMNIFRKAFIGAYPCYKETSTEVLE
ncbi:15179_t:CDS:2 [Funneliformis mosseae]|uniref:15179_t:CDS:1 n=1 Tax=Funneliformis mosseae TaxID=27381 RepID=A0A9N9DRR4_FUNMO|nr:15179_t:CDS:2 [Funneliformis mosseae]